MKSLSDVIRLCEKTASWDGVAISDLKQRNCLGDTVLHTVCTWGDSEAAKTLIDAGADVNAQGDNGATPLFNAIIGGQARLVNLLLERGAKLNVANMHGTTPLQYAKNIGAEASIVELLQKKGK